MTGARGFRGFLQRFFFPDVETLLTASDELDQRLNRVDQSVSLLDTNIGALGKGVGSLDASLALLVDQGLARLNDGMRQLDRNMGQIHRGMVQLNLGMDQLNKDTDEREKDLSTRLTLLKAKLQDDHTRAMGEIAALLEEHAYTERQEAAEREAQALAESAPSKAPLSPQLHSAATAAAQPASKSSMPGIAQETLPAQAAFTAAPAPAPAPAAAAPAAPAYPTYASLAEDAEEPPPSTPSRPPAAAVSQAPTPAPLPLPTYAQQREEELANRAEALADPVATINRLSALFGRPKGAADAFNGAPALESAEDATLDFAAILEGIKRSGMREAQARGR